MTHIIKQMARFVLSTKREPAAKLRCFDSLLVRLYRFVSCFAIILCLMPATLLLADDAKEEISISENDAAVLASAPLAYFILPELIEDDISIDDVAIEGVAAPVALFKQEDTFSSHSKIVNYAKSFWGEAEEEYKRRNISISGTKTFEMKRAKVKGDLGHFSTENYDSIPGFYLDQSLHLRIEGNITENSTVNAVLDDKNDEERRFTVNIDGPQWQFVMGDFPLEIEGTKYTINRKEVRGLFANWIVNDAWTSSFLFSQSKGLARREQFRGAGQQQEFKLQGSPIVQNSERIKIDGMLLNRGSDYYIDYDDGTLKFLPHLLPLEVTRWIVAEYEVTDKSMAFNRNLYGTRLTHSFGELNKIGFTWLREVDGKTPKYDDNASGTVSPMQHDILQTDFELKSKNGLALNIESSFSILDPNINSNDNPEDAEMKGNATEIELLKKNERTDAQLSFKKIDRNFKVVGREDGVTELGERGLVNDIMSNKFRLSYKILDSLEGFVDNERSKTNLDNELDQSTINFRDTNGGVIYSSRPTSRIELRKGQQLDREFGPDIASSLRRDNSSAVLDNKFGELNTQFKLSKVSYDDSKNTASGSEVIETNFHLGSNANPIFAWDASVSKVTVEDDSVIDSLRSDTKNYSLNMSYEPSRSFDFKSNFQWRTEDDFFLNSRLKSEIADTQVNYEVNRDIRTQLKYKIENTSTVVRDPNLDIERYILPPRLPNSEKDKQEILNRFDNPVQNTTANFVSDYRINRFLQAYFDWKRRELDDKVTKERVSTNDRKNYELRYSPSARMQIITEYEEGLNKNLSQTLNVEDNLAGIRVRHEFYTGCFLDAALEQREEDDKFFRENDSVTKTKILGYQQNINNWSSVELELQHDKVDSREARTEWEQRLAVILTPFSRSQRYRFYINHKDISADISGRLVEGGLSFSQFIGTDTIIDGVIKKIVASESLKGDAYNALVFNAQMVITF